MGGFARLLLRLRSVTMMVEHFDKLSDHTSTNCYAEHGVASAKTDCG